MDASFPRLRPTTSAILVCVLAAAWLLAAPLAAAQNGCVVSVEPTSGRVGTEFVVRGSGFGEPTIVTVLRNGAVVRETEVELAAETGAFTLSVRTDAAGTWLVRAILPDTECGDEVEFSVLPDTATDDVDATGAEPSIVAPVVLVAGFWLALAATLRFARGKR